LNQATTTLTRAETHASSHEINGMLGYMADRQQMMHKRMTIVE
jgi:hypothetical protein